MATNSGAYYLADRPGMYEFQRNNAFEFIVTGLDSLKKLDGTSFGEGYAQDVLRFSVVSFPVPTFQQEVQTIRRGNSVINGAGVPTFSSGSLVINDYLGADGKSILMAWQKLSYDPETDQIGLMSDYKKDCTVLEYSPDMKTVVKEWVLKGCWISNLQQDPFTKENGDKRTVTATITYDKGYAITPKTVLA